MNGIKALQNTGISLYKAPLQLRALMELDFWSINSIDWNPWSQALEEKLAKASKKAQATATSRDRSELTTSKPQKKTARRFCGLKKFRSWKTATSSEKGNPKNSVKEFFGELLLIVWVLFVCFVFSFLSLCLFVTPYPVLSPGRTRRIRGPNPGPVSTIFYGSGEQSFGMGNNVSTRTLKLTQFRIWKILVGLGRRLYFLSFWEGAFLGAFASKLWGV